jgi:outer membrane protein OmpA-like peptidoglycan-associated protein
MRIGKALCLLALLPAALLAQRAGTTELGVFGHYSKLDDDVLLGKTSVGVGGRLGFFALRYIGLEAEYSYGTLDDNIRGATSWRVFRGFVNGHITTSARTRLILGAGYKHDTWNNDSTKNEFEDGFTAAAGLRFCFGDAWSLRPDIVYDKNPSPNFQRPTTETSRHFAFRVGISRFLGRGHGTCRAASDIVDSRPMPAAPVTPPPSMPAATATLSASPTSIMAGGSSTLTWSSMNATSCTAPWTTSTATSGTQSVSPTSTTTYTITCTGSGGSGSGSATVSVAMPAPPVPVQPPAQQPPREVFRLEGVFFDFDKSDIKPEGRVKLDSAVTILNRFPDMRVEIQGHTDSIATEQYNIGLSNRRANSVKAYLMSKGIAESRLMTRGFGETSPAADNGTAAGRALNRRVILIEIR